MAPGYGKVTVVYDKNRVDVLWSGEVPKAVTAAVEAGSKAGVEVTVAQSKYSQADAADAAQRILEKYKEGVQDVLPNDDLSGLIVEVDENSEFVKDSERSASEFAEVGGIPATVEIGSGAPIPTTRQNTPAPYKGGAAIGDATGWDYCSTGFSVLKSDGSGRLLSAFHCNTAVGNTIRNGVGTPDRHGLVPGRKPRR